MDGAIAARIGWANSSFRSAEDLRKHVNNLALRIATSQGTLSSIQNGYQRECRGNWECGEGS